MYENYIEYVRAPAHTKFHCDKKEKRKKTKKKDKNKIKAERGVGEKEIYGLNILESLALRYTHEQAPQPFHPCFIYIAFILSTESVCIYIHTQLQTIFDEY